MGARAPRMSSFHFVSEQPDEQLFTDIQKMGAFSQEVLAELVTVLLNVAQGAQDLSTGLTQFCEEHNINEARLRPSMEAKFPRFVSLCHWSDTPGERGIGCGME